MAVPSQDDLGERLGIVLKDPEAIRQAFVHSSYFNENPHAVSGHNERLEFLGDAVIGLIVSRLLYERFPNEDEGLLTARRAALVNRDALAFLGLQIGLDRHLLLGRGESEAGGATRPSVLAGAFEALAGAIFLSEGMEVSRHWLVRLFDAPMPGAGEPEPPKSAKSRLQEWSQREHRIKPHYELVSTIGPDHEQTFTVAAVLRGERIAIGEGSSRQRAEEQAASAALDSLGLGSSGIGV
jgi:ribonuclease III